MPTGAEPCGSDQLRRHDGRTRRGPIWGQWRRANEALESQQLLRMVLVLLLLLCCVCVCGQFLWLLFLLLCS